MNSTAGKSYLIFQVENVFGPAIWIFTDALLAFRTLRNGAIPEKLQRQQWPS